MKRVYADIVADLFHAGHVEFLRQARALGDELVVGVHNDDGCEWIEQLREALVHVQQVRAEGPTQPDTRFARSTTTGIDGTTYEVYAPASQDVRHVCSGPRIHAGTVGHGGRSPRSKAATMKRFGSIRPGRSALLVGLVIVASVFTVGGTATAAPTPVGLGTATSFAVRAGDTITNAVAGTQITGDVGLPAPFAGITGLVCANIPSGTIFATDGAAAGPAPCSASDPGTTVASDAQASFNNASALSGATPLGVDLVGQNLVAGLYSFGAAATNLTGTLTLNAAGDPNAVWIFQASSTLITSSATTVTIINAPAGSNLACNVFWTVGSSATIGASSTFVGTILASADITVNGPTSGTATVVNGRLLAANQGSGAGQVTIPGLATITRPAGCTTLPAGTGGTPIPTTPVITPVVGTPGRLTG